jgi:hypothetical protein
MIEVAPAAVKPRSENAMPRFTFDLLVSARRARPSAPTDRGDAASADRRVDWRPLPNERRNRERRGTLGFARFTGPGGDVEHTMSASDAQAIADALGVPFAFAAAENVRTLMP